MWDGGQTMKEQAYNYLTKTKLKDVLDELACDHRSSWTKGQLVSEVCAQPVSDVLEAMFSTDITLILNKLNINY